MTIPFFRTIPVLLLHKGELVKSIQFKKLNYIGDPINAVKIFNEKEVDELIILDISATRQKKQPEYDLLGEIVSEAFMPIAYGGGINNIDDAKILFSLGIEKLVLNTALIENEKLFNEISDIFGAQSVVASIDYKKSFWGKRFPYSHVKKRIMKNLTVEQLLNRAQSLNAAEVIVNSVDNDGTMSGCDIDYIRDLIKNTNINIIPIGGIGSFNDIKILKAVAGARAVAAGSFFVYQNVDHSVMINYLSPNEREEINLWQEIYR